MQERRQAPRPRTLLSGTIAFNRRASVMSCVVRNLTPGGAKVQFDQGSIVPDEIDLSVPHRAECWRGRIIWRSEQEAGIAFTQQRAPAQVIPLEVAARLNKLSIENKALRQKLDRMRGDD